MAFRPPLDAYDVLIYLRSKQVPLVESAVDRPSHPLHRGSQEGTVPGGVMPVVDFNPVSLYLSELQVSQLVAINNLCVCVCACAFVFVCACACVCLCLREKHVPAGYCALSFNRAIISVPGKQNGLLIDMFVLQDKLNVSALAFLGIIRRHRPVFLRSPWWDGYCGSMETKSLCTTSIQG